MPKSRAPDSAPLRLDPTELPHPLSRQPARSSTHDSAFNSTGAGIGLVAAPRLLPNARCPADHWPEPAHALQKNRSTEISAARPPGRSRLRLAFGGPPELDQRSGRLLHSAINLDGHLLLILGSRVVVQDFTQLPADVTIGAICAYEKSSIGPFLRHP